MKTYGWEEQIDLFYFDGFAALGNAKTGEMWFRVSTSPWFSTDWGGLSPLVSDVLLASPHNCRLGFQFFSLVFATVTVCSWQPSEAGPCHSRHSPWLNGSTSLLWRKHKVCNRGQARHVLAADANLHPQILCPFLPYPWTDRDSDRGQRRKTAQNSLGPCGTVVQDVPVGKISPLPVQRFALLQSLRTVSQYFLSYCSIRTPETRCLKECC